SDLVGPRPYSDSVGLAQSHVRLPIRHHPQLVYPLLAYVSGERSGIIFETPFKMGETLNGKNDLNIKEEKMVIQDRHRQLIIENANEEAISSSMKDFGLQRFLTFKFSFTSDI
ncbi:hypothetical protein Tco_0100600, partial [Tanacetum coccineum]